MATASSGQLASAARHQKAKHVLETTIGDHTVLLDRRTERSHVLNPSAALIWDALDGDRSPDEVYRDLQDLIGGDPETFRRDVYNTIGQFVAMGIACQVGTPSESIELTHDARSTDARDVPLRQHSSAHGRDLPATSRVWFAGVVAEVRSNDAALIECLDVAFESMPQASDHDVVCAMTVIDSGEASHLRYQLTVNGIPFDSAFDREVALSKVLTELNRWAVAGTRGHVLLHAGAVERDGRVVVIAGSSGRGKSTLTAALVRSGFSYLTDEMVVIDPATGFVRPYPKPIDLGPESVALLGLGADDEIPAWDKCRVPASRLGTISVGGVIGSFVLLASPESPVDERAGLLEALDPVDALVEVLNDTFEETFALPDVLTVLAGLVQAARAHRLKRGRLSDAVAAVESSLSTSTAVAGADAPALRQ